MTVTTQTIKTEPYEGDDVSTRFAFDFHLLEHAHLHVICSSNEQEKTLQEGVDYTVEYYENADSGFIDLTQTLPYGDKLTLWRHVPITQESDYVQGDAFGAESHERALDKLTHIAQQMQYDIDRSIKTTEPEDVEISFPTLKQRVNKVLGFDELGQGQALTISNGLVKKNDLIQVKPHIGVLSNEHGVSVLYGDGLGVYNNAIVVKLGQGLGFDEQDRIAIQDELIQAIKETENRLINLQGFIAHLTIRIENLEAGGGIEVPIYIGNGLVYDEHGNLVVKPHTGINVGADGVSVRLGKGLEVDFNGDIQVKTGKGLETGHDGHLELKTGTGLNLDNDLLSANIADLEQMDNAELGKLVDAAGFTNWFTEHSLQEEDGWCRLPNGLLLQWGRGITAVIGKYNPRTLGGVTYYTHSGRQAYNIPFQECCFSLQATLLGTSHLAQGSMAGHSLAIHTDISRYPTEHKSYFTTNATSFVLGGVLHYLWFAIGI